MAKYRRLGKINELNKNIEDTLTNYTVLTADGLSYVSAESFYITDGMVIFYARKNNAQANVAFFKYVTAVWATEKKELSAETPS